MNEDELKATAALEDEDAILPDGWDGKSDIFDDASFSTPASEETPAEETTADSEPEGDIPTTDAAEDDDGQSAEEATTDEQPGQVEETVEEAPKKYKIKVNHEERELTLEELLAEAQKGAAFDQLKEQQNKTKFRQVYQEQIDAGMTEAAAKLVAKNECDGKAYALTDEEETPAETEAPVVEPLVRSTSDLANEIETFYTLHPSERNKQVPDEVALAVAQGGSFTQTYLGYMNKRDQAANSSLKKENRILKQNAASAAKAPVKGTTGGGDTKQKPKSDFLLGFESDDW